MEKYLFESQEDEELFKEFLLVHGFKMVATKDTFSLSESKYSILLQTENKQLLKNLRRWAWNNDALLLHNPEQYDFEIFKNLHAFVIESDFINKFPFPELLDGKYIKAELEIDLLKSILTDMKNYGNK